MYTVYMSEIICDKSKRHESSKWTRMVHEMKCTRFLQNHKVAVISARVFYIQSIIYIVIEFGSFLLLIGLPVLFALSIQSCLLVHQRALLLTAFLQIIRTFLKTIRNQLFTALQTNSLKSFLKKGRKNIFPYFPYLFQ